MDTTRCPHCANRMKVVATANGRTGFQCLRCDQDESHQTNTAKLATYRLITKAA